MPHYELAVIGSGSGNSLLTEHWDGRRVAVIDGGTFGGTCLNVGCIPTKMFVYPAGLAASAAHARRLGVGLRVEDVDWPGIRDRIFGRIDAISAAGRDYRDLELEHVDLYQEHVEFTGPTSLVTASGKELSADRIVVAAGSRAVLPDIPGIDLPQVHTSDTVMRLEKLPGRLVVLGGGFIAAEFAHVFSALGTDVVQANRSARLLRSHDALVSERFATAAAARWTLRLGWTVTGITEAGDGVEVSFRDDDGAVHTEHADVVLAATGRVPNTDRLGLGAAGFDTTDEGILSVDAYQRVLSGGKPVDGVFALGDIANPFQLKHVANREARVVAHNLEHPHEMRAMDRSHVPAAVFSEPQIAAVGLTEEQAREQAGEGEEITTVVQDYGSTAYGWAMEDEEGFVKLVAERRSGRLLGAHLMGAQASILIQPLIQALATGLHVHTMARGQYWIHPALSEVVENALLGLGVDPPPEPAL
ncbi:mycothione reductase [Zafaria sp. Z1313]|uniref:mycothione reductase n=1 Tax=unclassified Zafaria TaxID=2828765 RepID=UPI002E791D7B|nr:mycothione reductase [Zafaria sp. J156]MEE1622156.1 mycothione reductase [Zafaria sp. J156]